MFILNSVQIHYTAVHVYKSSQPITDQLGGVKAGSPQTLRCLLVAQFYVNEAKTEKINTVTVNTHNKHSVNDPESDPLTGGARGGGAGGGRAGGGAVGGVPLSLC